MYFSREFIISHLPEAQYHGKQLTKHLTFAVDSRSVNKGDMFIALVGTRVDGHDFVAEAVTRGATSFLISASRQDTVKLLQATPDITYIIVPDTMHALITLSSAWRQQFTYPVVGITGSIGKTSTKELLGAMLAAAGKTYLLSQGNQNTLVGCALNILRMSSEHHVAVFEMGINKRGEMALMADMVRPTMAIITTIGHSHMEGLGSMHDIAAEKRNIFKYLQPEQVGIVNGDIAVLHGISYPHLVMRFGRKTTNQIQARKIALKNGSLTATIKIYDERYDVVLPTQHEGPLMNGLAAATAAHVLGLPHTAIIQALQKSVVVPGRFEKLQATSSRATLINDCYNASPESMKAALLAFEHMEPATHAKIAILGDMLELGATTPFWHRQLGRFLRKVPSLKRVILVGQHVAWTKKTLPAFVKCDIVPTWQEAITCVRSELNSDTIVLVKGSRGVGLNNVVQLLTEK